MADIWKAYEFLNESMKLNLDKATLMKAEAQFKEQFLKERGFPAALTEDPSQWEFFAYLAPARERAKG